MIEISTKLNHCLKNLNCDFSVNITRTCELDITELIKCDILNDNSLVEICEKLFKEIKIFKKSNFKRVKESVYARTPYWLITFFILF